MTLNKQTLEHIKAFEGLRLTAYPDPGSRDGTPWTIGYGHTKGVKKGDKITKAQAEKFLLQDMATAIRGVDSSVEVPLNENQRGALISFAFNVGVGAFKRSTLLRRLNAGKYEDVPAQLMRWVNNDGKYMKGLARRRSSEGVLWNTPVEASKPVRPRQPAAEETQGKPATQSTTIWATIVSAITGILAALQGLDTPVAIAVIVVIAVCGGWVYRERMKKSKDLAI